jgi:hypothetical protein
VLTFISLSPGNERLQKLVDDLPVEEIHRLNAEADALWRMGFFADELAVRVDDEGPQIVPKMFLFGA